MHFVWTRSTGCCCHSYCLVRVNPDGGDGGRYLDHLRTVMTAGSTAAATYNTDNKICRRCASSGSGQWEPNSFAHTGALPQH